MNKTHARTHTHRNARARMHITTYMTMNCYGDQKEHLAMVLVTAHIVNLTIPPKKEEI